MDISTARFRLDNRFIKKFAGKQPEFGPLGYTIYKRTYSRHLKSISEHHQTLAREYQLSTSEEYWLSLVRVVEGCYRVQEAHCKNLRLPWNARKAQYSAQEMYRLMWEFKFLPPGRGLWMMGTPYIEERRTSAPLYNCSFYSTQDLKTSFSDPFCFLMDMSMLGVGVGVDTRGTNTVNIKRPRQSSDTHKVTDNREGWVEIVRRYLDAYVGRDTIPQQVDFSDVRGAGSPIKGFGGVSAGPEPLAELLRNIQKTLDPLAGELITTTAIVDLFDLIGRCVVAGNTRRSAILVLGDPKDDEFLELKDSDIYPEACSHHRWAANHSILVQIGTDYTETASLAAVSGEPGYVWLENLRSYSRMIDPPDYKDKDVQGTNPCGEIGLSSGEMCNLADIFPAHHKDYKEFERTLKFAYLYTKTVTLIPTHNERTNAVVMRNRRIGMSLSGLAQALTRHSRYMVRQWCNQGYQYLKDLDDLYSRWLCIPRSIKVTTAKPSGSVSLLAGATPGIHYPHSEYYHRVVRFARNSPLLLEFRKAGYRCEEIPDEPNTVAVYFAVKEKYFDRAKEDVSIWEQLENAAMIQGYWADNATSCTISVTEEEIKQIPYALEIFETRLKGISFFPLVHKYEHAPFQKISKEEYEQYTSKLSSLDLSEATNEIIERFCDGESCSVVS
jgi:adenosylcobalamin-dependent ribonucleoside-triphosphate reductase